MGEVVLRWGFRIDFLVRWGLPYFIYPRVA